MFSLQWVETRLPSFRGDGQSGGRAKRTESLPTRHGENCLYGIKLGEADRGVGGIIPTLHDA